MATKGHSLTQANGLVTVDPILRLRVTTPALLAQSFSPFSARDGRQVCRPSWIWATSLCYILLNKFVTLVGSGRQTCCPSHDEKGLKDWAIEIYNPKSSLVRFENKKIFFLLLTKGL
jgi:hypothetical protein